MSFDTPRASDALQFDHVEHSASAPADDAPSVACTVCGTAMRSEYHHVNGKPACDECRRSVVAAAVPARGAAAWTRATLFGVGAAIAGAIAYYAVIAITDLEIGFVAILIGYMVGWSVHRATRGRGSRKFQILAAALTYWSVGLAYTPIAFKGMSDGKSEKAAVADSTGAKRDSATIDSVKRGTTAAATTKSDTSPLAAIGFLVVFTFALPVVAVAGSLPGGVLSAIIIFLGLRQAWRMTGAPPVVVSGPYRVGPA